MDEKIQQICIQLGRDWSKKFSSKNEEQTDALTLYAAIKSTAAFVCSEEKTSLTFLEGLLRYLSSRKISVNWQFDRTLKCKDVAESIQQHEYQTVRRLLSKQLKSVRKTVGWSRKYDIIGFDFLVIFLTYRVRVYQMGWAKSF